MKAFRPQTPGMAQRLYDLIYTSIEFSVKSFAREDAKRASLGGRNIAFLINAAAQDAIDDFVAKEPYMRAITKDVDKKPEDDA